jgi:nucleoside phosphorylase
MDNWEKYIRSKLNSDIWGGVVLDYYAYLKKQDENQTPSLYIDWIIENIFSKKINIVNFHRVFLGVCVRLLGSDFNSICEKSVKLLKIVPDKVNESLVRELAKQFAIYGMAEIFQRTLKIDPDLAAKLSQKSQINTVVATSYTSLNNKPRIGKSHSNLPKNIDVAIITILDDEYKAVLNELDSHERPRGLKTPNLFAWELGKINRANSALPYNVVVALAGHKGTLSGEYVTLKTIEVWAPRYILLVGIAGGFTRNELKLGDVVVSDLIRGYEYGKISGQQIFTPRDDLEYPVDTPLVTNARSLSVKEPNWAKKIVQFAPEKGIEPKMVAGPVASGDKVVDDPTNSFFSHVLDRWPDIQAIEMEGVGAAFAIHKAREEGKVVGFVMLRGISDMPKPEVLSQSTISTAAQTSERDKWKPFASKSAACFAVKLIREAWPVAPQ